MRPFGIAFICALLLAPFLWIPQIAQGRDMVALGSQYLGLAALIAMAVSQFIATRWRAVEILFGPMDQSYRIHKWLGIGAMIAVLIHDTVDAEMRGLGQETALVDVAETAGEISLYGLLILVVITIATFVPYHLWKWTHRLIGIFFVLGAFHYLFILKPFKNGDPLGWYMMAICAVGLLSYLYTSAPRGWRPSAPYRISNVVHEGNALAVEMEPQGRPLNHLAGQFAFFRFIGAGRGEPHPFTISRAPSEDGKLRVTVAPLGDFTAKLSRDLKPGQDVGVDGPYGRFGTNLRGNQIWVAAGVGITPFLALSQKLTADDGEITLFYAVKRTEDAAHLDQLKDLAKTKPNLTLVLWESSKQGRIDAEKIAGICGDNLKGAKVLFCGPTSMRKSLAKGFSRLGVSARNFHYEAFEIRTGLGLRRLLGRI